MERIFRPPTSIIATDVNTIPTPSKQAPLLVSARFPKKYLHLAPIVGAYGSIGLASHLNKKVPVSYGGIVPPNSIDQGITNAGLGLAGLLNSTTHF